MHPPRHFLRIVASLALTLATGPARATPPDGELARLIAEALEKNPEVRQAVELAEAARQRVSPATALPDPMVSLSYENDGVAPSLGVEDMTLLQLMAQQAIPFPGKLALAGRIAGAEADEVAARAGRARLGVEGAVKRAYADLLAARQNVALVSEQVEAWEGIEAVTRARYGAGMGNQLDVLRAQSEGTRLRQQRLRDEAAERTALTELSRLLLRPLAAADVVGGRLARESLPRPPGRDEMLRLAEARSPELAEASLARERARLSSDLARRNLKPDFVATAGAMNRGGLPPMWSLGVGVTVPLWKSRKQAPLISEAEARERVAAASEASLRARLNARTDERLIRLQQLESESVLDAEGILVQDQLAVDAALANYRTGGVPFVSVLEALSTLYADRRAAVSRLADYLKTEADLHELALEGSAGSASMTPASAPAAMPAASKM